MRSGRGLESPIPASVRATVEQARAALGDRNAAMRYDWLQKLTGASWETISDVLAEFGELVPYEEAIRKAHWAAGRLHYAQYRGPLELYAIVRLIQPDHIIETGVSSGVSSAHFLLGVRKNRRGTLHSIDLPLPQRGARLSPRESHVAIPPGRSSGWSIPSELRDAWDLRIGPSQELLPTLVEELSSVGLFLHDSLHTPRHLTFELRTVRPKLVPGAVVLADNTQWTGAAFPQFARAVGVPVRRRGRTDMVGLRMPVPPAEVVPSRAPRTL
ncbi:MAG TPA: class I SAM-dependent methyltransferase [Thermoplasmata archaeon]|nr:class I SAM-dependent methyltransferase [Thermoplasmata archaeon]